MLKPMTWIPFRRLWTVTVVAAGVSCVAAAICVAGVYASTRMPRGSVTRTHAWRGREHPPAPTQISLACPSLPQPMTVTTPAPPTAFGTPAPPTAFGTPAPPTAFGTPAPAHVAPAVAMPAACPVDLRDTVLHLHDTHYAVGRDLVNCVLARPTFPDARIVPWVGDGRPGGFKLYGVRPLGVVAALGFENGDTVVSINGKSVTSGGEPTVTPYERLAPLQRTWTVAILRRGQRLNLYYVVV